jgi:hypothetical protein
MLCLAGQTVSCMSAPLVVINGFEDGMPGLSLDTTIIVFDDISIELHHASC